MPPTVRRRTAPRSGGYGAARPDVPEPQSKPEREIDEMFNAQHPGGTDEFASRRQRSGSNGRSTISSSGGRGWAVYHKNVSRSKRGFGDNPDEFKVAQFDEPHLIKMLDDEPIWSYRQHFLNVITEGQRSFCCGGDQCPICDLGGEVNVYVVFDIALWVPDDISADGGSWVHKYWRASPDPANKVAAVADVAASWKNARALSDVYLQVSKTESKKKRNGKSYAEYSIAVVKERDVEEDHGAYSLEDEDYKEFGKNPFDPEQLFPANTLKELRAAAEWLDD